jgi:hypothetical protein
MKALWMLMLAACAGAASAQNLCPHASEIGQVQMVGAWGVELQGSASADTLVLEKHTAYSDSLSGTLHRGGEKRQVAGDVEDGEFTMEESADGVHISATWLGEVVEGSCGREIRGTWSIDAEGKDARDFVLRKQ